MADGKSGPNGTGTLAQHVAGRVMGLIGELAENRRQSASQELRLEGLARVLLGGVPFDTEHSGKVADVIDEAATIAHQRGEALFVAAQDIRTLGSGAHGKDES